MRGIPNLSNLKTKLDVMQTIVEAAGIRRIMEEESTKALRMDDDALEAALRAQGIDVRTLAQIPKTLNPTKA